jgi:hypothetical protein
VKIPRLILFIPGFLVAMVLGNFLFDLLLRLVNFIYSTESEFSFIWDSFLKTSLVTGTAMFAGVYIYPYRNKILPLIIFTTIEVVMLAGLYFLYDQFWETIKESTKPESIISQIAIVIGVIVGTGYMWREYHKGELSFD